MEILFAAIDTKLIMLSYHIKNYEVTTIPKTINNIRYNENTWTEDISIIMSCTIDNEFVEIYEFNKLDIENLVKNGYCKFVIERFCKKVKQICDERNWSNIPVYKVHLILYDLNQIITLFDSSESLKEHLKGSQINHYQDIYLYILGNMFKIPGYLPLSLKGQEMLCSMNYVMSYIPNKCNGIIAGLRISSFKENLCRYINPTILLNLTEFLFKLEYIIQKYKFIPQISINPVFFENGMLKQDFLKNNNGDWIVGKNKYNDETFITPYHVLAELLYWE